MMKKMLLIGLMIMTSLCVFGCSQPVVEEAVEEEVIEEEAIKEEAVVVEPEEADTTEGEAVAEDVVEDPVVEVEKFPAFTLTNLSEGKEVTEAIFSEYDLTLVNIWGTTCPPCIEEMPELEKLQNNYRDKGFKVLGIIADGNHLAADEITKALLVTYEHLVPNKAFYDEYLINIQFVPTTVFVNNKGEIVGKTMVGGYNYETFEETIKSLMELE